MVQALLWVAWPPGQCVEMDVHLGASSPQAEDPEPTGQAAQHCQAVVAAS